METAMKRILLIASLAAIVSAGPALAEDVGVGVGVGPVGAGVTVGAGHEGYRDHDRTVIHEHREPRDKTVIIKKDRPRVDKKVIIHDND
jgi:hypothetical protein